MDGRPSLQGLDSGIDTGDVMDFESSVECNQSTSSSLSTTSSTVPAPKTPIEKFRKHEILLCALFNHSCGFFGSVWLCLSK
uniref:Uncharacterized protein n=1 Tax=Magallana gigas TaxID=29159 RepID=A0A8W8I2E5_MAGGI